MRVAENNPQIIHWQFHLYIYIMVYFSLCFLLGLIYYVILKYSLLISSTSRMIHMYVFLLNNTSIDKDTNFLLVHFIIQIYPSSFNSQSYMKCYLDTSYWKAIDLPSQWTLSPLYNATLQLLLRRDLVHFTYVGWCRDCLWQYNMPQW